jgi:hypothetical protein
VCSRPGGGLLAARGHYTFYVCISRGQLKFALLFKTVVSHPADGYRIMLLRYNFVALGLIGSKMIERLSKLLCYFLN